MLTAFIFIVILGVLIFVHELGHFVTARRNGIRASEFGFGFPPRIFGFQKLTGNGQSRWRMIKGNKDGDDVSEVKDWEEIEKDNLERGTIYSLNLIPIGGFVKIKGEDGGHEEEKDSFSHQSAWVRIKVLAAGVVMNFLLAWALITLALMIGAPEAVESGGVNSKIQISEVVANSPASAMGLKIGDEIIKNQILSSGVTVTLNNISEVQSYIAEQKGQEMILKIKRGQEILELKGQPRVDYPEGQGPLGVSLAQTEIVSYPWHQAIWKGLLYTFNVIIAIFTAFLGLIKSLFMGQSVGADISGPVGIALLTREVANLGLVYILQFTALLSVNLGIINALPIPALDGGRILFVLIEKIKGSPVSQKIEQGFHTFFFILLIMLMIGVTFKDIAKLIK